VENPPPALVCLFPEIVLYFLGFSQELFSNCEFKKLEFFNFTLDKPKKDMVKMDGLGGGALKIIDFFNHFIHGF
jgi:hypothetical protein